MTAMLTLEHISVGGPKSPLIDISYNFEAGKFYTILGRTGAGKSELLRALMGLEELSGGQILLDGESLAARPIWDRNMALVYQQFINYPHLSVLENVAFPLRRRKFSGRAAREKAAHYLRLVGLEQLMDRRPSQLSGGQQQRVALARALAKDARILMLDEPLVNLDYKLREQLREEFPRLLAAAGGNSVILYTTTDPREALQMGDEVLVLHGGRIVGAGKPESLYHTPTSIAVAAVICDPPISFVSGTVADGQLVLAGNCALQGIGAAQLPAPGDYTIGIRPDAIELGGPLHARVVLTEISGSETIVHLDLEFGAAIMLLKGVSRFRAGDDIMVGIRVDALLLFDRDGSNIDAKKG
ncbi:MAG: ABC transporter ATP-binding protein [Pseudorhodobacter sp.]|nr:ABC transporter ATP-binding protein [Pseudorhodobacter sp.]